MKKNGTNKNGNIRNFFKPASPAKGSHPSQPGASQTSMPFLPSSPGSLVSSPASGRHTPPPPARPALGRDAVINGSDDDDDDSDASLPEFSVTLPRASAFPPPRDRNSCVTPKAKRTAHDFPSSPLSIRQQPKHKFDMKALLNNAARDDAAEATAQRVAAILREHDRDSESPPSKGPLQQQPANIQEHMLGLMESGRDDEVDRDKILRALERTDARAVHERWYFFKEYLGASPASRTPFPAGAAIGRWAFLDDTEARQGCIEQGIVQTALRKKQNLPDEIFLWLLDELCLEPQEALRVRYIEILALCPDQVRRHVDTEALCRLFQRLGSRWESTDLSARVEMVPAIGEPYPGRTWSHLGSVLRLLSAVAADLSDQAIAGAVKLLLRLGVDGVVQETVDLALAYRDAMQNLMTAVPLSRWDDFVGTSHPVMAIRMRYSRLYSAKMYVYRSTRVFRKQAYDGSRWSASPPAPRGRTSSGVGWPPCACSTNRRGRGRIRNRASASAPSSTGSTRTTSTSLGPPTTRT